ncbi:hypothetical protein BaRGS_00018594 [Batillaria attramentaria]|uniref:Uncharacterized protein n=1 Tax=Batillaria attramentaria TaxID=370345 RepID=A0ABD0KSP0_9CAEN
MCDKELQCSESRNGQKAQRWRKRRGEREQTNFFTCPCVPTYFFAVQSDSHKTRGHLRSTRLPSCTVTHTRNRHHRTQVAMFSRAPNHGSRDAFLNAATDPRGLPAATLKETPFREGSCDTHQSSTDTVTKVKVR